MRGARPCDALSVWQALPRRLAIPLMTVLAGCAPLAPQEAVQTQSYVCAGGAGFRLLTAAERADIEIDGMRFRLQPEAASDSETVLSCSMLKLVRTGATARVEMEGRRYLEDCRRLP